MLIVDCVMAVRAPEPRGTIEDVIFNVQPLTEDGEGFQAAFFIAPLPGSQNSELVLVTQAGEEFALTLKMEAPQQAELLTSFLRKQQFIKLVYLDNDQVASTPDAFNIPLQFYSTQKTALEAAIGMRA